MDGCMGIKESSTRHALASRVLRMSKDNRSVLGYGDTIQRGINSKSSHMAAAINGDSTSISKGNSS
jgi:hypothetical protein